MMNVQPDSKYVQELMGDPDSLAKLLESHGTLSVYVLARQLGDVRTTLNERERDIARLKLRADGAEERERKAIERADATDKRLEEVERALQAMKDSHQTLTSRCKTRFDELGQSVDELRVAKV